MQPETSSLARDVPSATGTLILGDGTAPGLVIVHRSLLSRICAQSHNGGASLPREQLGLLLGPEPQNDDVLVEEAIPLGTEYFFTRSLERFRAGIDSVQPILAEARQEQCQTIVGLYRVSRSGQDEVSNSSLEFLAASGQEPSLLSKVRCCFLLVPLSASQTSLRVLMRKGEHWDQIQEATLESVPPSRNSTLQPPAAKLNRIERPRISESAATILERLFHIDRIWVDATIVGLLLLLLMVSTLLIWVVKRTPRETVNLQPLTRQIAELTAAVSNLRAAAVAPATFPLEPPVSAAVPKLQPPIAAPAVSPLEIPSVVPALPKTPFSSRQSARADVPRSSPPLDADRLAIAQRPVTVKPAEAFQFKVTGNPAPEVHWSSEGPGSIDPVYGLYRAPDQFTGETKVKITATSWRGSQSVTFTLRGTSKGSERRP